MTHKLFGRMLAAESFGADLRQAIRQICKAPAFSASVVLHADRDIVGKTIHLDSEGYEVVAPPHRRGDYYTARFLF
jgi:hypothetical protein